MDTPPPPQAPEPPESSEQPEPPESPDTDTTTTDREPPGPPSYSSSEQSADGHGNGPRVSREQMKDLARLRRTVGSERRLAGVAGGIARHFDIDPLLVRVAFVITVFFGGAGLVAYLGCWLVLPEDTGRTVIPTEDRTRTVVIIGLAGLAALLVIGDSFGGANGWPVLALAAIAIVVLLVSRRSDDPRPRYGETAAEAADRAQRQSAGQQSSTAGADPNSTQPVSQAPLGYDTSYDGYPGFAQPSPPTPSAGYGVRSPDPRKRGPILFWAVVASVVLGWGVLGLIDVTGAALPFAAYPALGLAFVGAGLLIGSTWGRAGGLIALGVLLLFPLAGATAVDRIDAEPRVIAPASGETIPATYSHNVGEFTVDLSNVDPDDLDRSLSIDGGVGKILVIVPDEVDVRATGDIGLGNLELFGEQADDPGARITRSDEGPGDQLLDLEVQLGLGDIVVARESDR